MSEPLIVTYEENSQENKDTRGVLNTIRKRLEFIYGLVGVLLSLAAPYGNMTPFGLAFLTLERSLKKRTIIAAVSVILGSLFFGNRVYSAKYIAAEIIYVAALFVLEKGVKISFVASALVAVISLLISGGAVIYFQGITLYSMVLLAVELMLTLGGIFVFDKCKKIFISYKADKLDLKATDRIYICVFFLLLLLSFKNMYIGSSISVINIASSLLLMCIGLATTAPISAAAGVIIGMICGIETDYFLPLVGAFGFCGFLSGLFSRFNRGGAASGLILANAVLAVYTNSAIEPMLKIYEILFSVILLIFIPDRFIQSIADVLEINNFDRAGLIKLKDNVKLKLKSVSESFSSMSETIESLSESREEEDLLDVGVMFDNMAEKVCKECKKSSLCWGRDFSKTYRELFNLLSLMEKNGTVEVKDLSKEIKDKCFNINKLLEEMSVQYDSYRIKKVWRSRLFENRLLAGQQLFGMSEILKDISLNLDKDLSMFSGEILRRELIKNGFKPKSIDVFEDRRGKIRISIILKKKYLSSDYEDKIRECLNNTCPREVQVSVSKTEKNPYLKITAYETEKFIVEEGFASATVSDNSGDNFQFYKLTDGKYVIALSDGMGTGSAAAKESRAVIELMDSFLRAGFDKKIAVNLINSVLLMKSDSRTFATIDMCIIDLYTGRAEFIKTGAEPSYIKKSESVLSVSGSALPAGISVKAEPEVFSCSLSEGDTVIMATDGLKTKDSGDGWLKKFIEENTSDDGAENFAEKLLKKAEEVNQGIKDDMTVISVKLHKKAC